MTEFERYVERVRRRLVRHGLSKRQSTEAVTRYRFSIQASWAHNESIDDAAHEVHHDWALARSGYGYGPR